MLTVQPFPWRRLSPSSQMEHCLDAGGFLRLRGADPETPPLARARIATAFHSFVEVPLAQIGLVWSRAEDGDGWILRTEGVPSTMTHLGARWGEKVRAASPVGVDERFVLVTLACESGDIAPDASGYVKAPRTELGYPQRTGEQDHGDFTRDAADWRASRGMHSSHGLMQTLIGVATMARPDLFRGVDPSLYRTVLWVPENSLACGLAHLAHFARDVLADPLASRFHYGADIAHASTSNAWGVAPVYDDRVPLRFIGFWNDDACVRTRGGIADDEPETVPSTERSPALAWLAALSSFALAATAAAYGLAHLVTARRFAS